MINDCEYNSRTGQYDDPITSYSTCINFRKSERQLIREQEEREWASMSDEQQQQFIQNDREFEERKKNNFHY